MTVPNHTSSTPPLFFSSFEEKNQGYALNFLSFICENFTIFNFCQETTLFTTIRTILICIHLFLCFRNSVLKSLIYVFALPDTNSLSSFSWVCRLISQKTNDRNKVTPLSSHPKKRSYACHFPQLWTNSDTDRPTTSKKNSGLFILILRTSRGGGYEKKQNEYCKWTYKWTPPAALLLRYFYRLPRSQVHSCEIHSKRFPLPSRVLQGRTFLFLVVLLCSTLDKG